MVWPTISGKMVESRDHVRRTSRRPPLFIAITRFMSLASTYGPFLRLRLIVVLAGEGMLRKRRPGGQPAGSTSPRGGRAPRGGMCYARDALAGPQAAGTMRKPSAVSASCPFPHDELVSRLATAGLLAHGHLAPLGLRLAADGRLAFATTVRMVARVHGRAADCRADAKMASSAGFTDADRGVLGVAHLAQRGHALDVHQAHLAGRQADLRPAALLGHQLRAHARAAHHLAASAGLELDVVDDGADRDVSERQRVAGRQVSFGAGAQARADAHAHRRQDVAALAVLVLQQSNPRAAVGVVFDRDHARLHADLVALPVDDAVQPLVPTTTMARGNAAIAVSSRRLLQRLGQRALWLGLGDLVEGRRGHAAATGRRWLVRLDRHQ